jgi:CcmD family protein
MENFLHNNSLFLVLAIALIIWVGIAIYVYAIDKKVSRLEKDFDLIKTSTSENDL